MRGNMLSVVTRKSNPKSEAPNLKMMSKNQGRVRTAVVGSRSRFRKPPIRPDEPLLFKDSSCFDQPLSATGTGILPTKIPNQGAKSFCSDKPPNIVRKKLFSANANVVTNREAAKTTTSGKLEIPKLPCQSTDAITTKESTQLMKTHLKVLKKKLKERRRNIASASVSSLNETKRLSTKERTWGRLKTQYSIYGQPE